MLIPRLPFKLGFALAVYFEGGCAHNYLNSPGYSISPVVHISFKIGPLINFLRYAPPPLVVGGGSEVGFFCTEGNPISLEV